MASGGEKCSSGTIKMIEKLRNSVESGNFYEAQQMYKGVYARYMGQKKYTEAAELLLSGATVQLQHGQVTCGSELGQLLIEAFVKTDTKYDEASIGKIRAIYDAFPKENKSGNGKGEASVEDSGEEHNSSSSLSRVQSCSAFLRAAMKWSANHGAPRHGAPEIHDMMAEYLWSQSTNPALGTISKYFIHGTKPEAFASAIIDTMRNCYPSEMDLVLANGVFQYLAVGNLRDANKLISEIERREKAFSAPQVPDTPLIHFLKFLLKTLERDALPLFRMLRNHYRTSIDRDPAFNEYLDEIATRFYGVPKPGGGMQGMFGDIMKMLAGPE